MNNKENEIILKDYLIKELKKITLSIVYIFPSIFLFFFSAVVCNYIPLPFIVLFGGFFLADFFKKDFVSSIFVATFLIMPLITFGYKYDTLISTWGVFGSILVVFFLLFSTCYGISIYMDSHSGKKKEDDIPEYDNFLN